MAATLIRGKPLADRIRAQVALDVAAIGHIGLVTVLVGDDPASDVYIRLKHKAATEAFGAAGEQIEQQIGMLLAQDIVTAAALNHGLGAAPEMLDVSEADPVYACR